MESLGEKLRSARESKGCDYEQASRETNIAARYLEALEIEDFSKFPGEPYLLGFLRNYGDYLGLDSKDLLNLYRGLKIQEQPIPVEQLLRDPVRKSKLVPILAILLIFLLGGGAGAYFFFFRISRKEASPAKEIRSPKEYAMDGPFLTGRFYIGDSILIPLGEEKYKLALINLGETVTILTPNREVKLDLLQEVNEDLNNDGVIDLRITAEEFSKNSPDAGVQLRLDLENAPIFDAAVPDAAGGDNPAVSSTATTPKEVYFTSANTYPFTLQAVFQSYCMFRWQVLGERTRANRNEQYFQRGEELNIQAQNGIRLWVSNAAAVKLQLIGGGREVPVEIGGAGEVVVAEIRWGSRNEEGRWRLGQFSLD